MIGILLKLVPVYWRWLAIGVLILAAVAFGWVKRGEHDQAKYDALQASYEAFKAKVAGEGIAAQQQAQKQIAANKDAKEKADEDNQTQLAALHKSIDELRRQRDSARRSLVPSAASSAKSPDRACFDRTELESAIRQYRDSVRGLVDQGSEAVIDLNTAKLWASKLELTRAR